MVPRLESAPLGGPPNIQVAEPRVAEMLHQRGIIWVPDYVASAGGVIYALSVELRHETHASALARVQAIEETVMQILDVTEQTGRTPAYAAQELVRHRLGTHFRPRRDWLREKTGLEPAYSVGGPGAASCRWARPFAP